MPKLLMLDDTAAHQIRMVYVGADIGVTCSCLPDGTVLKHAPELPADEALEVHKDHEARAGEVA